MTTPPDNRIRTAAQEEDEKAVRSVPLDTEDGGTVVIEQQNMGGSQQVGGGEYKNVSGGRTVEEAGAEQERLEREAPIANDSSGPDDESESGKAGQDPDAPGVSVLGLQDGDPVEPNEPA